MKRLAVLVLAAATVLGGCTAPSRDPLPTPTVTHPAAQPTAGDEQGAWTQESLRDGLTTVPGTQLVGAVEDSGGTPDGWYAALEILEGARIDDVAASFAAQLTAMGLEASTATVEEGLEVTATSSDVEHPTTYDVVVASGDATMPGYVAVMAVQLDVTAVAGS